MEQVPTSPSLGFDSTFDYVIVGGGPAGLLLAEQLSRVPQVSIAVLEAGTDDTGIDDITIPGLTGNNEFSPRMWDYYLVPQEHLDGATPRLSQGMLFGGGTSVNYLNYNRGAKTVFDEWANVSGIPGLAWQSFINDFKATTKLEPNGHLLDYSQVLNIEAYGDGPVSLTRAQDLSDLDPWLHYALKDTFNLPEVDFNSGAGVGVSYGLNTIMPGSRTRESSQTAYGSLMANRTNVNLVHGAYVNKIRFDGNKATSLTYADTNDGNKTYTLHAREIILSAGSIGTPKLLMLSGVGPQSHLEELEIPVVLANEQIGSRLKDHHIASLEMQVRDDVYTVSELMNPDYFHRALQSFKNNGTGPLAGAPASSLAIVRVPDSALPAGPAGDWHRSVPADRGHLMIQGGPVPLHSNDFSSKIACLIVALVQPEASGTVRLASANFWDYPLLDTAYWGTEGDRSAIIWGYKAARRLLESPWLKGRVIKETYPGPEVTSDEALTEAIKKSSMSYHHPMGTVALGSVQDKDFRVKGLQGLRVVDASVFPSPPTGHTQAAVYAVAHLAARHIRKSDGWE